MTRFQESLQSLRQLRHVINVGRSGGDLHQVADLVDSFLETPQMEACIARFRALPEGAAMMDERYPPLQPNIDRLAQLPPRTLGHSYASLILRLRYDPEFFRHRPIESEGQWLTQRIATTHDLHHVVSGFDTSPVGESGVLAITATQIGFPAYVSLNHAAQISSFRLDVGRFTALSASISHGVAMGWSAQAFCTARWEEGWELPLQEWRERLGVKHPADTAPYGLLASQPAQGA
jgi:ubiquinone biosynthesis protein Coq4